MDEPITYPPIGGENRYTRDTDWWSPHNYDGGFSGPITLRRALEQSKNVVTARLLDGGVMDAPKASLNAICRLAIEAKVYPECIHFYPFVLGAQPVRPIDLAAFYATIYNEGGHPIPHVIESITQDGRSIYKANEQLKFMPSVDRATMFQLRTLLQGVVARGTARRLAALSDFIGGKTGTSDDFNDAWFMGFDNNVTIAVWVGYDNAKGKRTLGNGNAGSRVALPIFDSIIQSVWAQYTPRTPLVGPSREASRRLIALPIDVHSGERIETRSRNAFMEYFRLDDDGRFNETRYRLVSRRHDYSVNRGTDENEPRLGAPWFFGGGYQRGYDSPLLQQQPFGGSDWERNDQRYLRQPRLEPEYDANDDRPPPRAPRAAPGVFWGGQPGY
jgi:penicillin-binding protein 1A